MKRSESGRKLGVLDRVQAVLSWPGKRSPAWVRALVFSMVLGIAVTMAGRSFHHYRHGVLDPHRMARGQWAERIVRGDVESPYRYRILIPSLTVRISRAVPGLGVDQVDRGVALVSLLLVYLAVGVSLLAATQSLFLAVLGLGLTALPWNTTFRFHGYQPWSYLEPFFLVFALRAVERDRPLRFAGVSILAALNRETGVLFALLAVKRGLEQSKAREPKGRRWWWFAATAPVVTYAALRLVLGHAPHAHGLLWLWRQNMQDLPALGRIWGEYYGLAWPVVLGLVVGLRHRVEWVLYGVANVFVIFFFGLWIETRMLNTLAVFVAVAGIPEVMGFVKSRWRIAASGLKDEIISAVP